LSHVDALRESDDNVNSYELFEDRKNDSICYSVKTFDNEKYLQAHNGSEELKRFLSELGEYIEGGADYHECNLVVAL
jgi:quinol monooxygenase YgiN